MYLLHHEQLLSTSWNAALCRERNNSLKTHLRHKLYLIMFSESLIFRLSWQKKSLLMVFFVISTKLSVHAIRKWGKKRLLKG